MGAMAGIVQIVFGIFWTAIAFTIGQTAPFPINLAFPLFGVLFVIIGIVSVAYNARNATAKNRFSDFDITSPQEESDPLNKLVLGDAAQSTSAESRLLRLKSLKEKGLISEEEYLSQKKRILSSL
jgi:hypothetical protein